VCIAQLVPLVWRESRRVTDRQRRSVDHLRFDQDRSACCRVAEKSRMGCATSPREP
jgi:hypothetical protein